MKIYYISFILLTVNFLYVKAQPLEESIIWKFETGPVNSNPLVHDSMVFCGSIDSCFYAIELNTGQERWNYKLPHPVTSTPAVYQKVICVRSGNTLYCFNKQSGTLLWKFSFIEKEPFTGQPTAYNHSSPVIHKEVVYFGDELGNINGVGIEKGELVFNYNTKKNYDRASDYVIASTPAIENGIIYFGDNGANMYAVSLNSQQLIWAHKVESPKWDGSIISEIVIKDSVLYFGGYNNTFCPLNKYTGNPIWIFTDENTFLPSTPIFYKDKVIIGSTINSEKIHALLVSTGTEDWSFQAEGIFFVTPQIIKDSILIINSTNPFTDRVGQLYMLNCNNGKLIHKFKLSGSSETSPIYIEGKLIIGKNDGLYLINIEQYF